MNGVGVDDILKQDFRPRSMSAYRQFFGSSSVFQLPLSPIAVTPIHI